MRQRLTLQLFVLLFLVVNNVWASSASDKAAQSAFTDKYIEMQAKGGQDYKDWHDSIIDKGGQDPEANMLLNLDKGKKADGKDKTEQDKAADQQKFDDAVKKQGFMGDPTDSGPSDWSGYDIQTDKDGNITGFKEKDLDKKDTDGDGKVSKEVRDAWNKKKAEEDKKNGGPPGGIHKNPDWDKDGDGKPDPGFSLTCFSCTKLPSNAGSRIVDGGSGVAPQDACHKSGYASDASCDGGCHAGDTCIAVDVDKESGKTISSSTTREKGSTISCFTCQHTSMVTVTYIVLIIETPYERYILDNNLSPNIQGFIPTQVMALSKITAAPGQGIQQIAGMLPGASGSAMGLLGMMSSMDLQSMAGLMQQGLNKNGKYGNDCFSKDFKPADLSKAPAPADSGDKAKAPDTLQGPTPQGDFGTDPSQSMTTGGPVIACGQQNGEKALVVMDASGKAVDTITRDKLKKDPQAVQKAMEKAQEASDTIMSIRQQGFQSFLTQKAQSMAQGFIQKMQQKVLNKVQENFKKKKEDKKNKKQIIPNDPYYAVKEMKEKPAMIAAVPSIMGSMGGIGGGMGGTSGGIDMGRSKDEADEKIAYQWGLHAIGYTPLDDPNSAWHFVDFTKKNIIVAVIDSGLDMSHPDAPEYIWTNDKEIPDNGIDDDGDGYIDDVHGWNFLDNTNDLTDKQGHGSFVAGIIAAKWNNNIGIAGINPGAVIMPLKVADAQGHANSFNIFRAIHYAVDHGARVINISLGARGVSALEKEAITYARAMGVFVSVASGNGGESMTDFGPSSVNGAFAVGALNIEGTRSTISNYGPNNGLLAPGDEIISLIAKGTGKNLKMSELKAGYYPQSGTSFSSPMVAATASLLLVKDPTLTPQDIDDILYRSADSIGDKAWDDRNGSGVLNASAALQHIAQRPITIKIDETRLNKVNNKLSSVDVFVTVRGDISSYVIEIGKGKHASSFVQVAGPYTKEANHDWVAHIDKEKSLRGSNDWIIRIRATDKQSHEYNADMILEFK